MFRHLTRFGLEQKLQNQQQLRLLLLVLQQLLLLFLMNYLWEL
jgi:hypothetical protein